MNITLSSEKYQVIGIKKKSTADMFCNLKLGSLIKFEVEIKNIKEKHGRATYMKITNLNTKESTTKSFNQISKILEAFELAECCAFRPLPINPSIEEMMGMHE